MADDRWPQDAGNDEVATPGDGLRILGAEPAAGPTRPAEAPARAVHWPDEGPSWAAAEDPVLAEPVNDDVAADDIGSSTDLDADSGDATMAFPVLDLADTPAPNALDTEPPSFDESEMPHWSEPPTGSMPAVFDQDDSERANDWAAITGSQPRFRSGDGDWDDDGFADDLAEAAAADPAMQGGALGTPEADPNASDEEFAAAVAQRRGGSREVETPRRRPRVAAPRPTARPGAGTQAAAPSGRNLPVALATAGLLGTVAVLCFIAGEGLTALLAAVILGAASGELVATLRRKNLATAHLVVIVGAAAMPLAGWWRGTLGVTVVAGLVVVTTLLWFLFEAGPGRPLIGSAMTLFAFAWVGGLGGFAGLLLSGDQGVEWLLAALIPTICYDVFGYFCGQQFGKTQLAPSVSPNKTLEGTVGGILLGLVITAAILLRFLAPFEDHATWVVLIGIFGPSAALLGDLAQSMIKRDLGIKDFSATLPGHGGVLDRFDGLLFALPAVYFLMLAFTN